MRLIDADALKTAHEQRVSGSNIIRAERPWIQLRPIAEEPIVPDIGRWKE